MIALDMDTIKISMKDGGPSKKLPTIAGVEYIRIPEEMAYLLKRLETYHGVLGFEYDPDKGERTMAVMLGRR